jgi:hypothetical protein
MPTKLSPSRHLRIGRSKAGLDRQFRERVERSIAAGDERAPSGPPLRLSDQQLNCLMGTSKNYSRQVATNLTR